MNTRINGSLQNPANVQAAACIPGVLLNVSITTPAMTDRHLNNEIEIQKRGSDPQEMNVVQDQDLNQHKHHEIYETTQ